MSPLEITLVILLVTIIAFVSGKVPFSVISTGIILALILTGIKTPAEAFGGFINTNVVMFVAMFVIGAGLTKTPLIDKAQSLVIRYKDNMRMLIFLSCVAGAFLVSIAMMLLENVIGVKMYLTSCIGAAALVLTGVLTEKEALNSIHQPTIFLFAGVLALSDAIQTTGAGDVVADWMIRLLGDTTNPYIIMLVFFLVPFILTQVMSNLATLTIFIPLVTSACIRMGVDPRAAVVGVITASCVSIMTPMAAPCQIMIIEPGGYTLKDYLKCGTPLALILIVVSVFFLPTLYPFA